MSDKSCVHDRTAAKVVSLPDCRGAGVGMVQAGLDRTEEGIGLLCVPAGCKPSLLRMVAVSVESMLVLLVSLVVLPAVTAATLGLPH